MRILKPTKKTSPSLKSLSPILSEDKSCAPYESDQPLQSLPSHISPTVVVTETEEELFSFDKVVQQNPYLCWAVAVEDQPPDPDQPIQSSPSYLPPVLEVAVARPEEEFFSFDKFLLQRPSLSWVVEGKVAGKEATVPPSTLPARLPSQLAVIPETEADSAHTELMETSFLGQSSFSPGDTSTPLRHSKRRRSTPTSQPQSPHASGKSSSSDSLLKALLQPPVSMRISEPSQKTSTSPKSLSPTPSREAASAHPELMETSFIGQSSSSPEETSPLRHGKRRRSEPTSQPQSPPASESVSTPSRHIDTGLGDLDAKSALFLARQQFSTAIDPYAVGLAAMHEALRDGARLRKELERDAILIGKPRHKKPCVCNVSRHPSWWSVDHIQDVHNYSFLLDCQEITFENVSIVAANNTRSIIVYDIPTDHNNPAKLKAEQVLRYIDVEVGIGDQTCDNLFHYKQPKTRKILMVVSFDRVVGIVVAEKILIAHRILWETPGYMELEENPVSVRVGINQLWVHISMRRRHMASMLCQLIGKLFYENETLNVEDFAFNNISPVMVAFAKVYLKTLRPPLYYLEYY